MCFLIQLSRKNIYSSSRSGTADTVRRRSVAGITNGGNTLKEEYLDHFFTKINSAELHTSVELWQQQRVL